jgi:hypothetical protein
MAFNFTSQGPAIVKPGKDPDAAEDAAQAKAGVVDKNPDPFDKKKSKGKMPPALQAALQRRLSNMNSK